MCSIAHIHMFTDAIFLSVVVFSLNYVPCPLFYYYFYLHLSCCDTYTLPAPLTVFKGVMALYGSKRCKGT